MGQKSHDDPHDFRYQYKSDINLWETLGSQRQSIKYLNFVIYFYFRYRWKYVWGKNYCTLLFIRHNDNSTGRKGEKFDKGVTAPPFHSNPSLWMLWYILMSFNCVLPIWSVSFICIWIERSANIYYWEYVGLPYTKG